MRTQDLTETQQEALRVFRMSRTLVLEKDDEFAKMTPMWYLVQIQAEQTKPSEEVLLSA